jgi:tetratricopeptide (TPR) repeat protein
MRRAFTDPDPLVRLGALRGFAPGGPDDLQLVLPLLADPMRVVRFAAVTVLLPAYPQIPLALRGQLDTQVEAYLEHLATNADRAEALTNRALVHLAKNDLASAEADFRLALRRNPAWVPGLVNLADLYRGSGRDEQAGELLQQAMALAPEATQVRVAYALWQVRQGQLDGAIQVLAKGHKMRPQASSGYIYAVALSSARRPAEALQVVDELLQADMYSPSLLQLGINLARQSQSAEQLARYQAALQAL